MPLSRRLTAHRPSDDNKVAEDERSALLGGTGVGLACCVMTHRRTGGSIESRT